MEIKTIMKDDELGDLNNIANQIRCSILKMVTESQVGHIGGSFSVTEILVALYFKILNINPANPNWEDRDRLILSKGHGSTALYSTLAARGYFSKDILGTFGKINSLLQVHPDKTKVPGLDASTGALGMGLSIGAGIAYAARIDKKEYRTYVIIGDGESQEGQIWEAAMFCANYALDNLIAILDYNKIQLMGNINDIMKIAPVKDKWVSFGWNTIEIDGHNILEIIHACNEANKMKGKPTIIIANTIKGKGVSFIQNTCEWHGKVPSKVEYDRAFDELQSKDYE
jgi:transketolase